MLGSASYYEQLDECDFEDFRHIKSVVFSCMENQTFTYMSVNSYPCNASDQVLCLELALIFEMKLRFRCSLFPDTFSLTL